MLGHETGGSSAGEIVRVAGGGTLVVKVEGAAVDTSGTRAVDDSVVVYAEVGGDTLKGVFIRSPFDEGKAIKHGENTDIDAVVLHYISPSVPEDGGALSGRGTSLT